LKKCGKKDGVSTAALIFPTAVEHGTILSGSKVLEFDFISLLNSG